MNTKVTSLAHRASMWALGSLAALSVAGTPAFAQHGGGGHGGGGGGGGGHASMSGGGHGGGGGGGHGGSFGGGFGGGGRGGFAGARGGFGGGGFAGSRASGFGGAYSGARPMGFSSGHAIVGGRGVAASGFAASAGPHYAPRGTSSGLRGGYAGGTAASVSAYRNGYAGRPGYTARSAYVGRPAYGYGWGRGGFGYHRGYWGGGYWHGGFWPRCYYGWSYPWFLGALPAVYATYWWGGVPYYYANNVYYTWNNGSNGYVVTDPPPADGEDSASSDGNYDSAEPGSTGGSVGSSGSAEVYAYPKSGQSDEQQATDRYECHKWAVAQSGFDPTRGSQAAGNSADYRRAMVACLDGRGYSSK